MIKVEFTVKGSTIEEVERLWGIIKGYVENILQAEIEGGIVERKKDE